MDSIGLKILHNYEENYNQGNNSSEKQIPSPDKLDHAPIGVASSTGPSDGWRKPRKD